MILKFARVIEIVYDEQNRPHAWHDGGTDSTPFDDENKKVLTQILTNKKRDNISIDGRYTITKDANGISLNHDDSVYSSEKEKRYEIAINRAIQDLCDESSWLYEDMFLILKEMIADLTLVDFALELFKNIIDNKKQNGKINQDDIKKYSEQVKSSEVFINAKNKKSRTYKALSDNLDSIEDGIGFHFNAKGVERLVAKCNGHYFSFDTIVYEEFVVNENRNNIYHNNILIKYPQVCELQYMDTKYAFNYVIPAFYFSLNFLDLNNIADEKTLNPFYYIWDFA